ncbi:MAG: tetratricopeptide repeat protein, partial [Thermoplasmata archaeon]
AYALAKSGDFVNALKVIDEVIKQNENDVTFYVTKIEIYVMSEKTDDAKKTYEDNLNTFGSQILNKLMDDVYFIKGLRAFITVITTISNKT